MDSKLWILAALLAATPLAPAQWLNYPTAGIPRTADGKPNLSAPAPRAHGKPDLSGLWQTDSAPPALLERLIPSATNGAGEEPLSQYFINIFSDFKAGRHPVSPRRRRVIPGTREEFHERVSHLALSSGGNADARNGARAV